MQSVILLSSCQIQPEPMQSITLTTGEQIKASPHQPVYYSQTEIIGTNNTKTVSTTKANGAGISTDGEVKNFNSDLPSITGEVGDSTTYATIAAKLTNPMNIFFILSAVSLLAAIPVFIWINKKAGILLAVSAGLLLSTALLANAAPILFGLSIFCILGVVGFMYVDSRWKEKVQSAFKTVVSKIEQAPVEIQKPLKESIKEADKNNGSVKEVVTELKKEINN